MKPLQSSQRWTTRELTSDLAHKLRMDLWLTVAEVTLRPETLQRADLLAMRRSLVEKPMLIFEIKISRSDLLADLRSGKWKGYMADGAVVFAFPAGLADPKEIPIEAGVIVRVGQGWSWRRGVRLKDAPLPSPYLYRRMALSAWDQSGAKVRSEFEPRAANEWSLSARARTELGRRLATINSDIGMWQSMVDKSRSEWNDLLERKLRLESEIHALWIERQKMRTVA